jgi:GNAT superfamily N-acetyltransferase
LTYRAEPLRDDHDLEHFDCGNAQLTDWLRRHSRHASAQGTRTYVLVEERGGEVAGYFAVAPHLIEREELPKRLSRGAPRQIPSVLLAKLALHRDLHGQGLGGELLVRALATIVEVSRTAGGKLVVVDAIDDAAAAFYRAHDFEPIPGAPHRLVKKLSSVAKALGLPWP